MNKYIWQIGQIHFAIWTNTTGKFRQMQMFWAQVAVSHIRPQPLNLSRELKGAHALCSRFQLCDDFDLRPGTNVFYLKLFFFILLVSIFPQQQIVLILSPRPWMVTIKLVISR